MRGLRRQRQRNGHPPENRRNLPPRELGEGELPDGRFLHAAALAYAVPLALFLAGLFAGYRWLGGEGAAILTGLLGLLLGMGFLRFKDRVLAGRPEWTPRVTAVYEDRSAVDALGCPGRE